ncbi:MAG TPA: 30S ribosomal protein S4 [Bacillota bacterium]|nr:MAG: 30S ribosomal protein S4 [Firmicutes bacterium ADurb.Bin153]HNV35287.1 30S ribosomal protein S4 [Bacillota bacterium]
MARMTDSVCSQCRRERVKLYLKGDRCYSSKCALTRRSKRFAPGQHGERQRKLSEYGVQLREKQKLRRIYGMMEAQFSNTFVKAERMKGITGETLLTLLEMRLDNVVYRLGFAKSRPQARQIVTHGHISVNGNKVDIPSYLVSVNDVIAVRDNSKDSKYFKAGLGITQRSMPGWLSVDLDNLKGTIIQAPTRDMIDTDVKEHLIVEFYSR